MRNDLPEEIKSQVKADIFSTSHHTPTEVAASFCMKACLKIFIFHPQSNDIFCGQIATRV